MTPFFDSFPKVDYKINAGTGLYQYTENVTNIFFRIGMIRDVINTASAYTVYEIQEGETPEILADRVYGDIGAGWIILYANKVFDPQFDWPLTNRQFDHYISKKYGSVEAARTTVHHYEKVIERTEPETKTVTVVRLPLSYTRLTTNEVDAPFDFYRSYLVKKGTTVDKTTIKSDSTAFTADDEDVIDYGLASERSVENIPVDGKTIQEVTYANAVSNYDYEEELNEQKRTIKIIKAEYYPLIIDQFKTLTGVQAPFLRKLPYT